MRSRALAAGLAAVAVAGCEDLSSFTTAEDEVYRGEVLDADIVRRGFESGAGLEMTFDVSLVNGDEGHVGPGTITTVPATEGGDVYFEHAPLVPVSAILHDQLSGLDFPTGRLKNYIFFADATGPFAGRQALVIVSLLSDGGVEARILMGGEDLYGIFTMQIEQL
jgi:hypothetical protein